MLIKTNYNLGLTCAWLSWKMDENTDLDRLTKQFDRICSNPETFLDPQTNLSKEFISSSKYLYDFMKEFEFNYTKRGNSLQELLVTGFDNEQIWQQIELQNNHFASLSRNNVKALKSLNESATKIEVIDQADINNDFVDDEVKENDITDEDNEDEDVEDEDETSCAPIKKYKSTVVDDPFFKLREMEDFLDQQDRLEEVQRDGGGPAKNDDDDIDFFKAENSDDDTQTKSYLMFKDFFDKPRQPKNMPQSKINELELDQGFADETNVAQDNFATEVSKVKEGEDFDLQYASHGAALKSTFERRQEEIELKISRLEESNLSNKPWQLKGEATSRVRPVNSLLEEHISFDHTSVGAPVVTEETTETLEDIVKQRIKDQAWDDVQRKQKPTTQPFEYKKAPELNMEKSKLSLAEVYEKEYLKQAENEKEEEKESEEHVLIKQLMDKLFVQLDALSNFQFTPKPPRPELKIISNAPSLQMEEVTPITMTTATQLAPEELYDKKKGDVKGDGEKTAEDRKRERRQKKIKKKFASKEKEKKEKLKAKSGNIAKSSTKTAIDMLKKGTRNTIVSEKNAAVKSVKSSNEFFTRLQDEAKKNITKQKSSANNIKIKKKKKSAEAFKL
ncbi:U3 small nucleolar ribonucleoprotein protein MPP10-like [Hydractinia symbiolongicarpus]|uniref:U3 small nucleolar ribonucleoprotein protein MPP10-like n=1 Tax=Hydractinia symbiolongicarpus TaxID=13093 RepID=UPI00254D1EA6|nr:U3 small nucleolar ribonucleoprotein protein MPP10-like [Hydractinia symbiolongicarpus]XP_057302912.1 U3 small nucleolar ribonucleoprotein protein MPP10-like [Hydractinia symbiolongicarpus]